MGLCPLSFEKDKKRPYHNYKEIFFMKIQNVNDLVLILGAQQDITDDYTYDTSKAEAFFLPKGTNEDLTFTPDKDGEDKLLTAQNKWLIAHEEAEIPGAFCGLVGENITLK